MHEQLRLTSSDNKEGVIGAGVLIDSKPTTIVLNNVLFQNPNYLEFLGRFDVIGGTLYLDSITIRSKDGAPIATIPESPAIGMMLGGLAVIAVRARRRERKKPRSGGA